MKTQTNYLIDFNNLIDFIESPPFIVFYIISVLLYYRYVKKSHSKGGVWEGVDLDAGEFIFMFFPFVNFLIALDNPYKNKKEGWDRKKTDLINKFFNVKK